MKVIGKRSVWLNKASFSLIPGLDPTLVVDRSQQMPAKFEAVPLPVPASENDEGFFLWPRPGTIVTVGWIEGRPDHPVIQHVPENQL